MVFLCSFASCNNSAKDIKPPNEKVKNENMLVRTLVYTELIPISEIMSASYDYLRNSLIDGLKNKISDTQSSLQDMSDTDLSWAAIMYKFIIDSGIKNAEQLKSMTIEDCKNALILENATNTNYPANYYQSRSLSENLNTAYQWWFQKDPSTKAIIDNLNNVSENNPKHGLKDNRDIGMDVLRIVKADEDFTYLGVSHYMVSDGHFKLCLSGSNDLRSWTYIADIGDRAHQGDIEKWNGGYIVANEQDVLQGSNNIQVRFFPSYEDLKKNNPAYDKSIQRTLAPSAEGTPDIRKIEGESASSSYLLIGFHYYEDKIKDQLAFGILKNFSEWKAWKDVISNYNIQKMGYAGNIGGREYFNYSNSNYGLQEAQITSGDWGAWRVLFGNGIFYYSLHPVTSLSSISFANPGISCVGTNTFAVTYFMHAAGNDPQETGELIYNINF